MEASVLQTLEYSKIRTMLAAKSGSVMGREMAEALEPSADSAVVQHRLDETAEARSVMESVPSVPLGGIRDIRAAVKRAELGATLDIEEFVAIAGTLYAARQMKNFFSGLTLPLPILAAVAADITVFRQVEHSIENTINEHGSVRDDASPELARIRRDIKLYQSRVKDKLDSILRSAEYQKFFQDALVTMRGDRYVIPIKQEYRHSFPGIVHDQSASGATVFIEPLAVVSLNNDMKQLLSAEHNEVERILRLLTAQIAQVAEMLTVTCQALAQMDFAFAKAALSFDLRAQKPVINTRGYVKVNRARHPLIPQAVVVPIDIHIGDVFHILLITGPNTGGKTVTLKTLGLFALMTQAGLFVPAAAGAEMTVFPHVFADIGDEQSIEQSLSTFSAHMTNLVKILTKVAPGDLVLMDEIGAGTDPDEGAALAMAILERLADQRVITVATTHYSQLKTFAYSRPGVENASVEFDVQTLKPTYRLLIGVPGSSNAFAISRRLGLHSDMIERAQELVSKDYAEWEGVLQTLEQEKLLYLKRNEELRQLERQLAEIQSNVTAAEAELSVKKNRILGKAQSEASVLLRQARREAEGIIADLKVQIASGQTKDGQQAILRARKRISDQLGQLETPEEETGPCLPIASDKLQPGAWVYVTTLKQKGTILAVGTGELTVQLGIMKMNVPVTACRLAEPEKSFVQAKERRVSSFDAVKEVSRQIDVRGMTVDEAELVLEKYLDDIVIAGLNQVLVIHGKGTGALRKGVRIYLKNHHHVRDISIGEINEGGDGATLVKL